MLDEHYGFILISDEKYWNRLCERSRGVCETYAFVRRNLVGPNETQKLLFYVKRPSAEIRGIADFIERVAGNHRKLWNKYGKETCLKSFKEYLSFLAGRRKATFIRFTNFRLLEVPASIERVAKILGVSKMPRGGKYINREIVNQLTV